MTYDPLPTEQAVSAALRDGRNVQWKCGPDGDWMTSSLDADSSKSHILHCLKYGEFRAESLAPAAKPLSDCGGEWVMVPRVLTEAMKQAAWGVFDHIGDIKQAWAAMLAAAPASPTTRDAGGVGDRIALLENALREVLRTGLNGGNNLRLSFIAASRQALSDEDLRRADESEAAVVAARELLDNATPTPAGDLAAEVSKALADVEFLLQPEYGDLSRLLRYGAAVRLRAYINRSPQAASVDAKDAARFRALQDMCHTEAQAFFWNYRIKRKRAEAIDRHIAALDRSGAEGQS